jgi:hypothetical protein
MALSRFESRTFIKANAGSIFLFVVLTSSLALNVILALRLKSFPLPERTGVQLGTTLPSIPVLDNGGANKWIELTDSRPTVLYILSPLCRWCKRNEANVNALATAESSRYRFIGLSVTANSLKEYWKANPINFPVYLVASQDYIRNSGFGDLTPQTVVVSSNGRVERVWLGAYVGGEQANLEKFFAVKLPGLVPSSDSEKE